MNAGSWLALVGIASSVTAWSTHQLGGTARELAAKSRLSAIRRPQC